MKTKWWIALMAIIVVGSIFLFACHDSQKPKSEIVLNDILRLQQAQINSFNPLDAYHAGHIQIVKQLYNTLVDIDLNGRPVPSLAEKWESIDRKTWRFHLRKNVYFADDPCFANKSERMFVATDVKYTFERLLNKASTSLGVSYFTNILGAQKYREGKTNSLKGVRVVDNYTIDFVLEKENLSFPDLLTLSYASIVKKAALEHYGEKFKQHPIGTGPFMLKGYEPDKEITLVKNKDYWERQAGQQLPCVDNIVIHLTTDDNLALLMFKNKKSDFLELSLPLLKQLETMDMPFSYKTETRENPQLNFYLYNLKTIKDENVRKAINYALNRNELQEILSEQGNIAKSLYPPAIFENLASSKEILNYNPEKAKAYLKNINSLKLVCFEDILSKSVADFIARSLKKYDILVEIESVPFPVLVDRLTKGKYDLIQIYWGPLYADVCHYLNPFLTSSFPPTGNNFNKYSNPAFDKLVIETKLLPADKRKENFLKAEDQILNDMPFLLLYFKNTIRVSNERFDMPLHPLGYRFYKFAEKR
jgi:ABC-type transport system substrate-binding protein